MRVLLTSILCHTGMATHVQDLVNYLQQKGVFVAVAFKRVNFLAEQAERQLLSKLGGAPYLLYDTTDELLGFVVENKCGLIHGHSYATFETATKVSQELQTPLVVTLHSVFPWERFFHETLLTASGIIAVGPAQASSAKNFASKMVIIPNGIDTKAFVPSFETDSEDGAFRVLWYGRVDGRLSKGLHTLDGMAPLLPKQIKITALGSADFAPRNIPMLPWSDDPLPFLQQAHITFGHSRSLREAMAAGSVGMLLGYGYGGMITREWLQAGRAVDAFREYRLPRPQTRRILHDIMELVNGGKLAEFRQEARRLAEQYFDIEDMGRRTLNFYESHYRDGEG